MMDPDQGPSNEVNSSLPSSPPFDDSSGLNGQSLATAKVLFETRRSKIIPLNNLRGAKNDTSTESDANRILELTANLVSVPKSKIKSSLGQAVWLPDEHLALVTRKKGTLGFNRNGKHYLYPEEAAFALDNCEYEITLNSLPVSLEEAYTIFFRSQQEQDIFRVYSILRKHGFRVERVPSNCGQQCNKASANTCSLGKKKVNSPREDRTGDEESCKKAKIARDESPGDVEMTSHPESGLVKPLTVQMVHGEEKYLSHPVNLYVNYKAENWKQLKKAESIFKCDTHLTASAVEMSKIPPKVTACHPLLPPCTLKTDSTEPVVDVTHIMTISQLLTRLQAKGPSTYGGFTQVTSNGSDCPGESSDASSNLQVTFQVRTSGKQPVLVVIRSHFDEFPNFMQLRNLFNATESNSLVVAAVDESCVNFYKITSFEMWQEVPKLWMSLKG